MDITTPAERVAGTIRAEMARRRKTHAELASVLGLTRSSIHRRLSGEQPLALNEVHKVAAFLDVPVGMLLGTDVAA